MIGVSGEDRLGPVELLGEERPDDEVWPGHGSERKHEIGGRDEAGVETFGAADDEGEIADAPVLPVPDPFGERPAGEGLAGPVQGDHRGAPGQRRLEKLGLAPLERAGLEPAARLYLLEHQRPCEPPRVGLVERPGRVPPPAADRGDDDAQVRLPVARPAQAISSALAPVSGPISSRAAPHIFSRL